MLLYRRTGKPNYATEWPACLWMTKGLGNRRCKLSCPLSLRCGHFLGSALKCTSFRPMPVIRQRLTVFTSSLHNGKFLYSENSSEKWISGVTLCCGYSCWLKLHKLCVAQMPTLLSPVSVPRSVAIMHMSCCPISQILLASIHAKRLQWNEMLGLKKIKRKNCREVGSGQDHPITVNYP